MFSPEGSVFAGVDGRVLRLWDSVSGRSVLGFDLGSADVEHRAFSADGSQLVAQVGKRLYVWNTSTGDIIVNTDISLPILAFNGNATGYVTAAQKSAQLWQLESAEEELRTRVALVGQKQRVTGAVFSPDDRYLATTSTDGTVRVWSVTSFNVLMTIPESMSNLAFSSHDRLAVEASNGDVHVWDVANEEHVASLRPRGGPKGVSALVFSPDGARLATVSSGVQVWATDSGRLIGDFPDQRGIVGFTNETLATIASARVTLWPLPEVGLARLCRVIREARRYVEVAAICDPLLAQSEAGSP